MSSETAAAQRHPGLLLVVLLGLLLGILVPASPSAAAGRSAQSVGTAANTTAADFTPTPGNKKACKKKQKKVRKKTYTKQIRKKTKSQGKCGKKCRKQAKKKARAKAAKTYQRCIGYDTCTQSAVTFNSALVPSCGVLWGAVANAFGNRPGWPAQGPESHRKYEAQFGRTFGIYSYYYNSSDPVFPRSADIDLAREPGRERVIYAHWKIANSADVTFADVAAGRADARIDAQAAHLKANYPQKLFVSIQSEMEPLVDPSRGSGYTAEDYAAMYRHVVNRMRSQGVDNIIWVLAYGGYGKWATKPWFRDLYPGDAYVDWIGWHPFSNTTPIGENFKGLMNSRFGATDPSYKGMYNHLTRRHPGKPLMLSEFGIFHDPTDPTATLSRKAAFYNSVGRQLPQFPALKAIVNFDTDYDELKDNGYDITVLSNTGNRAAFQRLSDKPWLVNPLPQAGAVR